jgi:hypothetical protein
MNALILGLAIAIIAPVSGPVESQNSSQAPALTYADLADLSVSAPIAAHVRVTHSARLSADEAPNVPPGYRRILVEAEIVALIRGQGGIAGPVTWVVDLAADGRGRTANIQRRSEYLILAQPIPNRPNMLRLVAPDAQIPYSPAMADRLRAILREAAAADAPPRITGIGRAFHVAGSLPGESETQIFLQTANSRPISLTILRRPGERPSWSVALGEIVDAAAAAPAPESLLWYRLACTLPRRLPAQSLSEAAGDEAGAIEADYTLVMQGLGGCARSRRPAQQ